LTAWDGGATQRRPDGTVDSSGVLPDGTKFDGPAGLREVLISKREMFVETVTSGF